MNIRRLYKTTHGSTHSGSTVVSLTYKITFFKKNKKNLEYCHLNQIKSLLSIDSTPWFSKIYKTNDYQQEKAFYNY